jgi:two-component system OmpR family sensor kinase
VGGLPSIRRRLARAVLQVTLAWGVAAALLVGWAAHEEIDEVMDSTLQESAEILFGVLSFNAASLPLGRGDAMPAPPHDERLVWQVVGAQGQVLLRSHRAPTQALLAAPVARLQDAPGGWRLYAIPFVPAGPGSYLLVAQMESERREATLQASLSTAGAALVVALLCALWLRRRVRTELLPLRDLSRAVTNFHPTDAGATLAAPGREELLPIRDAILDLAERLSLRVDSERAFTAHAAHALRTPLAGLAAQLAVAMREAPPELQPRIQKARQASLRLQRVVNALLTLFRSSVEPKLQPVDLATLVHSLSMEGLQIEVVNAAAGRLQMDPDLIAAALLNLLDNAARHGATRVEIRVDKRGSDGVLGISDDGQGVGAERLGQLQAALAAQQYEQAMGLGLMLGDLVARAHHGRLTLLPAARGFALELTLPQELLRPPGS